MRATRVGKRSVRRVHLQARCATSAPRRSTCCRVSVIGRWFDAETTQGQTDSTGKRAPRVTEKQTKIERLRELLEAHPEWERDLDILGGELGVKKRQVQRY